MNSYKFCPRQRRRLGFSQTFWQQRSDSIDFPSISALKGIAFQWRAGTWGHKTLRSTLIQVTVLVEARKLCPTVKSGDLIITSKFIDLFQIQNTKRRSVTHSSISYIYFVNNVLSPASRGQTHSKHGMGRSTESFSK